LVVLHSPWTKMQWRLYLNFKRLSPKDWINKWSFPNHNLDWYTILFLFNPRTKQERWSLWLNFVLCLLCSTPVPNSAHHICSEYIADKSLVSRSSCQEWILLVIEPTSATSSSVKS
jgi:hypothetical protein